jgi:pimeloyl-ACP methyl ester carboxylesterase
MDSQKYKIKAMRIISVIVAFVLYSSQLTLTYAVAPDFTKTPIFFVHGYGLSASSWNTMISSLTDAGYPPEYLEAIQLVPDDGANIPAAEDQIALAIEAFLDSINTFLAANYPNIPLKTKVDLVSHSMGSLSSRWYAARVRPDRVHKWISLAGANHGTNDLCGRPSEGADDSCPAYAKNEQESYIQYQLNGAPYVADVDETPFGIGDDSSGVTVLPPDQTRRILYVTIRTSPDIWIDPEDSVILDGAGGVEISIPADLPATMTSEGNFLMTNGVGHDAMLSDPDTVRLVRIILSVSACECDLNADGSCDSLDWLLFYPDWGRTDCTGSPDPCECDLNDDGSCDSLDWLLFYPDWGRTDCP